MAASPWDSAPLSGSPSRRVAFAAPICRLDNAQCAHLHVFQPLARATPTIQENSAHRLCALDQNPDRDFTTTNEIYWAGNSDSIDPANLPRAQ